MLILLLVLRWNGFVSLSYLEPTVTVSMSAYPVPKEIPFLLYVCCPLCVRFVRKFAV